MNQQSGYIEYLRRPLIPRLPIEGKFDLTYRCNNNCRHCWLRIPSESDDKKDELSFEEIRSILDEARSLGCRRWSISGGEPMLRPDFADIFDYITSHSHSYSINTNGTLITPKIAQLMKRKGTKMVALYGATAQVHDHITRSPGSFELTMRGFRYLREAGAGFLVQLIPMRDNYHQFQKMLSLAKSLSPNWRIGASWLWLSACGRPEINREILRQRLAPNVVIELDKPDLSYQDWRRNEISQVCCSNKADGGLFSHCLSLRRDFHIDPYGQMSFCCFIKDPDLRYDLRKGTFKECWDKFIPSLANKLKVTQEYGENCGSCELRNDCRWCPVYGYLEHRRFSAKVEHLCEVAKENRRFKENWKKEHRRYYKIADITIQLDSDLPITDSTFHPKFKLFEADGPGEDTVTIRHHFSLPDFNSKDLGKEIYRRGPWVIYKNKNSWIYLGISPTWQDNGLHCVAVFNHDHTRVRIYNDKEETFRKGNLHALTLFPTDQILISRILADREGCYLHSCGVDFAGKGLLFVGHSEAGKSTIAMLLKDKAKVLCDDRIIVRNTKDGFKIYGTWSHGDVAEVSSDSTSLRAIMFLQKGEKNQINRMNNQKEIIKRLLGCLIKPFVTADWWEKTLVLIDKISGEVPCYLLKFDKSDRVPDLLKQL